MLRRHLNSVARRVGHVSIMGHLGTTPCVQWELMWLTFLVLFSRLSCMQRRQRSNVAGRVRGPCLLSWAIGLLQRVCGAVGAYVSSHFYSHQLAGGYATAGVAHTTLDYQGLWVAGTHLPW
jgi:hypothetical protein